jgi:D-amino-acid dehydrogenase
VQVAVTVGAALRFARSGVEVTIIIGTRFDGRATAAGAGIICPWVSGSDDPAFYQLCATAGAPFDPTRPAHGNASADR